MRHFSFSLLLVAMLTGISACSDTPTSGSSTSSSDEVATFRSEKESPENTIPSQTDYAKAEFAARPPRIGKTETLEVILQYTDGSWGLWLQEQVKDDPLLPVRILGPQVASFATVANWLGTNLIQENEATQTAEPDAGKDRVSVGKARWPSIIYAGRVLTTKPLYEDFEKQYGADFDIQLVKLPVSWFPARSENRDFSKALQAIEVQLTFDESESGHPVVQDVYPKTSFEDEGWKVYGKIGVGIGGFVKQQAVEGNLTANAGCSFEYTPLVARIISDGIGNQANWRIIEVKDEQPVGQIDYYCIVLVPRHIRTADATLELTLWFSESDDRYLKLPTQKVTVDFGRESE